MVIRSKEIGEVFNVSDWPILVDPNSPLTSMAGSWGASGVAGLDGLPTAVSSVRRREGCEADWCASQRGLTPGTPLGVMEAGTDDCGDELWKFRDKLLKGDRVLMFEAWFVPSLMTPITPESSVWQTLLMMHNKSIASSSLMMKIPPQ